MHFLRIWPSSAAVMNPLADGCRMSVTDQICCLELGTYGKLLGSFFDFLYLDFGEAFDTKKPFCSAADESLQM